MLRGIKILGYRGFRHYTVDSFTRVNLLVGKNNSGKTSVLEAIDLLASGGDPSVLLQTAFRRGEMLLEDETSERYRGNERLADISHFFYGHDFGLGKEFSLLTENSFGELTVGVREPSSIEDKEVFDMQLRFFDDKTPPRPFYALEFKSSATRVPTKIPVFSDGALGYRRLPISPINGTTPRQFITPDSLQTSFMANMWNKVLVEGRENDVISAVQILEPRLESIHFLSGERSVRYPRGGVLLGFQDVKRRIPLGSYGEGVRRLLALSLSLIQSANGLLLVDEIDTGLHWSILGDMWRLVVKAAQDSNVQVFATTHSFDCLRGLAWLCENYPDSAKDVTLHKIDPNLEEAVSLPSEQIKIAVDQGIEVR